MKTWIKRNRLWVVLLPLSLVLAALANSSAYFTFYRYQVPSVAHRASQGRATLDQSMNLKKQPDLRRKVTVWFIDMTEHPASSDGVEGTAVYTVHLRFEAPPTSPLTFCRGLLVDAKGNTYMAKDVTADCTPEGKRGPQPNMDSTFTPDPKDQPRPEEWTYALDFVIPAGLTIIEFRLYWQAPDYLSFPIR